MRKHILMILIAALVISCSGCWGGCSGSRANDTETTKDAGQDDPSEINEAETSEEDTSAEESEAEFTEADTSAEEFEAESKEKEPSEEETTAAETEKQTTAVETTKAAETMSRKDAEKSIRQMLDELYDFRYAFLIDSCYGNQLDKIGDKVELKLSAANMTRAAGMCRSIKRGKAALYGEEYEGCYLGESDVMKACRSIFDEKADVSALPTKWNGFFDVVQDAGRPALLYCVVETEMDENLMSTSIDGKGGEYTALQEVYQGYWGYAQYNKSNFRVTYRFKEKSGTRYGLILTGMTAERIADENQWGDSDSDSGFNDNIQSGFYGIWCTGTKSEADAEKFADKLSQKGFDARVFLSSDWENLNAKPYYVVTAGIYDTEADAKTALKKVKSAGYGDAYVKYSGKHR